MPLQEDDPRVRFGFDLYRNGSSEAIGPECYATEAEALEAIERLGRAGNFDEILLFRATPEGEWEEEHYRDFSPSDFEEPPHA